MQLGVAFQPQWYVCNGYSYGLTPYHRTDLQEYVVPAANPYAPIAPSYGAPYY